MYLSAAPKFPAQPRIVSGAITEGSSALCLISSVNPLNAVAAGSPAHHRASTSPQSPGKALPPVNPSRAGDHRQAASSGRGIHTCVEQDADAGETPWRSKAGGKETEGKGKAAWCPSVPTHADPQGGFQCPRGTSPPHERQKLTHPSFLHLLLARSEGDRFPKWGRRPSLPTHTRDPVTMSRPHAKPALWEKPTFPMPQKKDRYRPQPTASPCRGSGRF